MFPTSVAVFRSLNQPKRLLNLANIFDKLHYHLDPRLYQPARGLNLLVVFLQPRVYPGVPRFRTLFRAVHTSFRGGYTFFGGRCALFGTILPLRDIR